MATFAYTARDRSGRILKGTIDAGDRDDLRRQLRAHGIYLVGAEPPRRRRMDRSPKLKGRDLVLFTFQLQTILASGVSLLVGLEDMAKQTKARSFRRVIDGVRLAVEGGATLTQALERFPRAFSKSYTSMVEAGEESGKLEETLERLLALLEWREDLKSQVRSMVTYPSIVLTAVLGLIVLLLTFVIPRFEGMLTSLNVELPGVTRALLSVSGFVLHNWVFLLAGCAGTAAGWRFLRKLPRVRYAVDAATLRVPVLGSLVTDLHANQVCTFLGAFVETGVALTTGLGLLGRIAGNSKIARALERVRDRVTEGDTMTRAFEAAAIFPPLVQRMVSIGEETGQLPAALRRARTFYDREIPRRVKKIFDLIGPITTVLLGIILLVVILAVLLPVYKMYTAFSTGR